jgi:short-subunit dehydrogenase
VTGVPAGSSAELDGSVCVVTGASSGIGRSLAVALARRGASVWAIGRSSRRLDDLAAEVGEVDGRVRPLLADLERDGEVEAAARAILAGGERVDVLVHSAAVIVPGPFEVAATAEFDRQYRVNLRAPFVLTQLLLPALRRARGQVVFVNSSAGLTAAANNAQYAATKHGLKALADSLRQEVNPDGVRVLTVYPGRTATPMQELIHESEGRSYRPEFLLRPEDVVDVVLSALALPRTGEVTEVSVRPISKLPAT